MGSSTPTPRNHLNISTKLHCETHDCHSLHVIALRLSTEIKSNMLYAYMLGFGPCNVTADNQITLKFTVLKYSLIALRSCSRMQSHLLLFCKILPAKSSHFNRNPRNQEFCMKVERVPHGDAQIGRHVNLPC